MSKIYTVASGKGGVGKSTFCAGISKALENFNKKVLIIDGDIGFRSLDVLLGVDEMVVYDWSDFLSQQCDKSKCLLFAGENIHLLPAPLNFDGQLKKEQFSELLSAYKDDYDFIFIDSPAGANELPFVYSECSDGVIVVSTPDEISAKDACILGNSLIDNGFDETKLRLIINRFNEKSVKKGQSLNIDDMIDRTYIRLLGIVPDDNYYLLSQSFLSREKSNLDAEFAFQNIAQRIMGKDLPLIL